MKVICEDEPGVITDIYNVFLGKRVCVEFDSDHEEYCGYKLKDLFI
jgi:hypothetical protein